MEEVERTSPSSCKPISSRAERMGIGALLSNLREQQPAESLEERTSELCVESSFRPLNRREKRRIQAEKSKESLDCGANTATVEPCFKLPHLEPGFCDDVTFQNYTASFGYEATRNNNFVHIALQNESSTFAVVASQDRHIRGYDMENNKCKLKWQRNTGGLILDILWSKHLDSSSFFSSSKGRPIQLYDAETSEILATYYGKDNGDNIKEATCIGQTEDYLIGGFRNQFQIWDVNLSGNAISKISYLDKDYNGGFSGISMSIANHPTMSGLFAVAGTSDIVSLYSMQWNSAVSNITGSTKGYTDLHFSPDGFMLYASERSGDIHGFDTRMNKLTKILKREMKTAQRTRFDIESSGRILYTGTSSGDITAYDLHDYQEISDPVLTVNVSSTCIPCVRLLAFDGRR
uniref:WD repeat-containing protein 55 homolog n=1 Tax=Caenorhabditis japonica TaxID=281687 RepID=A0A8R1HI23_CAEJA